VTRLSFWAALATAMVLLVLARPARANREDKAQALFESATALFQQGDYEQAATRFMHAFKLVPHADTAFNAALSWDAAKDHARAANAFQLALDRGLPRKARERAKGRLDELKDDLGRLRVHAPDGSKVLVGDEKSNAPASVYVEPGEHDVIVVLPDGTRRVRRIHARAGHTVHVDVEAGPAKGSSSSSLRTVGWVSLAAAGVLGVASIALESSAASKRKAFNNSDRTNASQRDAVLHAQTWATLCWVATGAAAVTGVTLIVTTSSNGKKSTLAAVPGGLSFSRQF